jgi:hypothetical protein
MKSTLLALAALSLGGAGCVVVEHHDVKAGDPLDARLYLTWEMNDSKTSVRLDCQSAGADTVRVNATNAGTNKVYSDLFDCKAGAGRTYSLTAGDYYINVDLLSCGADSSCRSPFVVSSASTVGPYGVWSDGELDLGHFVFLVD